MFTLLRKKEDSQMIAEAIFTGTELLLGQILNTNAQYLQQTLAVLGIDLYHMVTVGDNQHRCAEAIRQAAAKADLIFVGGGLGPTEDDISREALAEACGLPMVHDDAALQIVQRRYLARGIRMPEVNLKQALLPEGSRVMDNTVGVAPGIILEHRGKTYFLLPGPPYEFENMLDNQVAPYLRERFPEEIATIYTRVLKLCGIGESFLAEKLGDLFKSKHPTVSTCVKGSYIDLSITAKDRDEDSARQAIDDMETTLRQYIDKYIFGVDKDTLEGVIGRELLSRGQTVGVVEDFSNGWLAHILSNDPYAARVFAGGVVLGGENNNWRGFNGKLSRTGEHEAADYLSGAVRDLTASSIGLAVVGPFLPHKKDRVTIGYNSGQKVYVKEQLIWEEEFNTARLMAEAALVHFWQLLKRSE
jgi:nicotinamide-nucleotide amidase